MTDWPAHDPLGLPGPRGFIGEVAAQALAGKTVVVVFPAYLVHNDTADRVLDLVLRDADADACDISTGSLPERLLTSFGHSSAEDSIVNWHNIVRWSAIRGRRILLDNWNHSDISTVLERWPVQLKASALEAKDRPALIVGVSGEHVNRRQLELLDSDFVHVMWWWGVYNRVDTDATVAYVTSRAGVNPVEAAVISEVASWDLELAAFLSTDWDRELGSISSLLATFRGGKPPAVGFPAIPTSRGQQRRPPAEREAEWNLGKVELWGNHLRSQPCDAGTDDIQRSVWAAQTRTLMTHVDLQRSALEEHFRREAPAALLEQLDRDYDILELGTMHHFVSSRRVDIGRPNRERLQAFWEVRNKLAHHEPVDNRQLRAVGGYIGF